MRYVWIMLRVISIPVAIIIGVKPLLDGELMWDDAIFPVFGALAVFTHVREYRRSRREQEEQATSEKPS